MEIKPETAFAVMSGAGYIFVWTISMTESGARDRVGRAWRPDDPAIGWAEARLEGYRVVRVTITANSG